jgi:hypothetical protein
VATIVVVSIASVDDSRPNRAGSESPDSSGPTYAVGDSFDRGGWVSTVATPVPDSSPSFAIRIS